MPYNLSRYNGSVIVNDNGITPVAGITLPGKNYLGYGQPVDQSLLNMTEHFANNTGPTNPITGQIWYDTSATNGVLKCRNKSNTDWDSILMAGSIVNNANFANFAGNVTVAAQPNITSVGTLTSLTVTGNTTSGNLTTAGTTTTVALNATGNVNLTGANVSLGAVANLKITGGTNGQVLTTNGTGTLSWSTVSAGDVVGPTSSTDNAVVRYDLTTGKLIQNSTVIISDSGAVSGVSTLTTTGALTVGGVSTLGPAGNVSITGGTSGQVLQTNGAGVLTWATVSAGGGLANGTSSATIPLINGNVLLTVGGTATVIATAAGANIAGTLTASASVQTPALTTGAIGTPGTITGDWTLTAGSTLNATYADMGERYTADHDYPPGTLLMIGGTKDITIATYEGRYRLAGVVSTEPAYTLNSDAKDSVVVALIGRVPCLVTGNISKGDMLTISNIDGVATSSTTREYGTIIGRALENYNDSNVGTIEIKVDRA